MGIQISSDNIPSRVKASDVGIEAHKGRSNVEVVSVSASAPRAEGEKEEAEKKAEEEEITRKRRNGLSTDQDQPQQSRLSNVFIPDVEDEIEEEAEEDIWEGQDYEYEEDDLFLSRDGADIDIGKLNMEERLKRRAQRRAERQAKRRAALALAEAALEES